jgi:hypothetical protein
LMHTTVPFNPGVVGCFLHKSHSFNFPNYFHLTGPTSASAMSPESSADWDTRPNKLVENRVNGLTVGPRKRV